MPLDRRAPCEAQFRTVRRIGAGVLLVAGLIDIVSAVTPPLRSRIEFVNDLFPLAVPQIATVLVAISGLALLLLSRGVRKGQRLAWNAALVILCASAVLHLLKGADIEEGAITAAVAAYLAVNARAFRAAGD